MIMFPISRGNYAYCQTLKIVSRLHVTVNNFLVPDINRSSDCIVSSSVTDLE